MWIYDLITISRAFLFKQEVNNYLGFFSFKVDKTVPLKKKEKKNPTFDYNDSWRPSILGLAVYFSKKCAEVCTHYSATTHFKRILYDCTTSVQPVHTAAGSGSGREFPWSAVLQVSNALQQNPRYHELGLM